MKLNLEQIKNITLGVDRVEQKEDGFHFYRFTPEQTELYRHRRDDFYRKTFCSAGVQFRFKTDSKTLSLKAGCFYEEARTYYAMDVHVNGKRIGSLCNFETTELPRDYIGVDLTLGECEKQFALGDGEKEIRIYFPWSVRTILREICLDDGASIVPIKATKKLLCFGDSITHGYDTLHPDCRHAANLADFLKAEEHNKAIGGDKFFPELAKTREDFTPDYILVAYGTNDWFCFPRDFAENGCREFYKNISSTYPNAKIFALTPIWRKDLDAQTEFGSFFDVEKMIASAVENLSNVTLINGYDLVPHNTDLYADVRLHPNDEGAKQYFDSLSSQIAEHL